MSTPNVPSVVTGASAPSVLGTSAMPAHLQQYAEQATASLVTGSVGFPAVSIRGKQFRYTVDGQEHVLPMGTPLNVIILAADPENGLAKTYYEGAYVAGADSPPDCASSDGIKPDGYVTSPKCRSCSECPLNAFGSGKDAAGNATKGKACSDHKNLYIVPADNLNSEIAALRVPATSLKALSRFGAELSGHKVPMYAVIVQLSFADTTHPQLTFSAVEWLSEADAKIAHDRSVDSTFRALMPSTRTSSSPAAAALPSAGPQLVATDKCQGFDLASLRGQGWTDEQLINNGYAASDAPDEAPSPPKAPEAPSPPKAPEAPSPSEPQNKMTAKAAEVTYEEFVANGWTDEQLIENNYMTTEA